MEFRNVVVAEVHPPVGQYSLSRKCVISFEQVRDGIVFPTLGFDEFVVWPLGEGDPYILDSKANKTRPYDVKVNLVVGGKSKLSEIVLSGNQSSRSKAIVKVSQELKRIGVEESINPANLRYLEDSPISH